MPEYSYHFYLANLGRNLWAAIKSLEIHLRYVLPCCWCSRSIWQAETLQLMSWEHFSRYFLLSCKWSRRKEAWQREESCGCTYLSLLELQSLPCRELRCRFIILVVKIWVFVCTSTILWCRSWWWVILWRCYFWEVPYWGTKIFRSYTFQQSK